MKIVKKDHYEVGDRVLIRDWDDMAEEYGTNDNGFITVDNLYFVPKMRVYCGEELTIKESAHECYRMKDTGAWIFPVESIAGVIEEDVPKVMKKDHYEAGDKVLIRDWNDMAEEYGVDDSGFIAVDNVCFTPAMKPFCRKVLTIEKKSEVFENCYQVGECFYGFPFYSIAGSVTETTDLIEEKVRETVDLAARTKIACDKLCDMVTDVPDDDIYELITLIQEGSVTDVDEIMARLKTKGYDEFVFADVPIPLLHIEKLDNSGIFETDLEAAKQAERDGTKVIHDIPIPDKSFCKPYEGTFVDTEENRSNLIRFLLEEMSKKYMVNPVDFLSPEQEEEIYRRKERIYRRMDLENHLENKGVSGERIDKILENEFFVKEICDLFESKKDCNVAENDTWDSVLDQFYIYDRSNYEILQIPNNHYWFIYSNEDDCYFGEFGTEAEAVVELSSWTVGEFTCRYAAELLE